MKFVIILLAMVTSVWAKDAVVFPQVINFGSFVQVQVHNTTPVQVNCSGNVYLYGTRGMIESHYYYQMVMGGSFSTRSFYPRTNERITNVSHSIFCY